MDAAKADTLQTHFADGVVRSVPEGQVSAKPKPKRRRKPAAEPDGGLFGG